ncbi:UNVERIFIED_CONTAM: hypothetical protein K2H54_047211 [Gekko kuhli]
MGRERTLPPSPLDPKDPRSESLASKGGLKTAASASLDDREEEAEFQPERLSPPKRRVAQTTAGAFTRERRRDSG